MSDADILNILTEAPGVFCADNYQFKNYLEKAKMKPDMKMMFGSYFQSGEICVLAGRTGVGKSILAYCIADGISRGVSILGEPNECEPLPVIYYDFELGESHIKKRFSDYEPNDNFYRPDVKELLINNDGNFNFEIIANDIDATGAKVVIIDNITAIALKSTQDQDTALQIMKGAMMLKSAKDVSILILAHTPKIAEARPLELYQISGAGHIHNFIDNAIMIGKSSQGLDRRYVKQVKSRNDSEKDNVLIIDIVEDNWLHFEKSGYDDESNHLEINIEKEELRKSKLIEIAECLFESGSLTYTDFLYQYETMFQKSKENAKKIHAQLKRCNIITKDADGRKWLINRNEVPN